LASMVPFQNLLLGYLLVPAVCSSRHFIDPVESVLDALVAELLAGGFGLERLAAEWALLVLCGLCLCHFLISFFSSSMNFFKLSISLSMVFR